MSLKAMIRVMLIFWPDFVVWHDKKKMFEGEGNNFGSVLWRWNENEEEGVCENGVEVGSKIWSLMTSE